MNNRHHVHMAIDLRSCPCYYLCLDCNVATSSICYFRLSSHSPHACFRLVFSIVAQFVHHVHIGRHVHMDSSPVLPFAPPLSNGGRDRFVSLGALVAPSSPNLFPQD